MTERRILPGNACAFLWSLPLHISPTRLASGFFRFQTLFWFVGNSDPGADVRIRVRRCTFAVWWSTCFHPRRRRTFLAQFKGCRLFCRSNAGRLSTRLRMKHVGADRRSLHGQRCARGDGRRALLATCQLRCLGVSHLSALFPRFPVRSARLSHTQLSSDSPQHFTDVMWGGHICDFLCRGRGRRAARSLTLHRGRFQSVIKDDDSCLREVIAGEAGCSAAALAAAAVLLDGRP